jgi:hypothetical protein
VNSLDNCTNAVVIEKLYFLGIRDHGVVRGDEVDAVEGEFLAPL